MMEDAAPGFGASLVPVVHVGTMAAAEIAKKKKSQKKERVAWSCPAPRPPHHLLLHRPCCCVFAAPV